MHHPNLCIRGERCTCINRHSLTHREERSRLRIYLLHDQPAGQPTSRPCTYVSPFRARTCVCILSEATYTTSVQQTGPVFRVSLKGERSEKGESKTRRDADVRGGVERRVGVRRGSRHEPNRNQRPTRLDQHLDAFSLSPFFSSRPPPSPFPSLFLPAPFLSLYIFLSLRLPVSHPFRFRSFPFP